MQISSEIANTTTAVSGRRSRLPLIRVTQGVTPPASSISASIAPSILPPKIKNEFWSEDSEGGAADHGKVCCGDEGQADQAIAVRVPNCKFHSDLLILRKCKRVSTSGTPGMVCIRVYHSVWGLLGAGWSRS